MHRLISSLLSTGLLLLMAACGSSGTGDLAGFRIPDVRTTVDGEGEAFGVAFLMVEASALTTTTVSAASAGTELAPLAMTEVQDGYHLGQLAEIDSAGNTTFNLPLPEEIPSGTIVDATAAFLNATTAPECSVVVEPAGVQMSVNAFELLAIPGFVGLVVTPSASSPISFAVLSDQFLDLDVPPENVRVYHWIYSDGAAVVSFDGTDCGYVSASGVEFRAGWNLIGWDIEAGTGEMVNVERPDTLFLTIQGEPPTP